MCSRRSGRWTASVRSTIKEVAQEISHLDPPAFPTIERVVVAEGREVLVATVTQGPVRPYSYEGNAYRREGYVSAGMSRDEYNRMLLARLHGNRRWENEPAVGWTVADLDIAEITRTIEAT